MGDLVGEREGALVTGDVVGEKVKEVMGACPTNNRL